MLARLGDTLVTVIAQVLYRKEPPEEDNWRALLSEIDWTLIQGGGD